MSPLKKLFDAKCSFASDNVTLLETIVHFALNTIECADRTNEGVQNKEKIAFLSSPLI